MDLVQSSRIRSTTSNRRKKMTILPPANPAISEIWDHSVVQADVNMKTPPLLMY